MTIIPSGELVEVTPPPTAPVVPAASRVRTFRRFRRNKVAMTALVALVVLVAVAALAPWLAPHDPNAQALTDRLQPMWTGGHPLGTDEFGRDQLSRLIFGARQSLLAALITISVGVGVGVPLGMAAGLRRGWIDALLSRLMDALMGVPALILALTIVAVLGRGLTNAMLSVGVIMVPRFFRVSRATTIEVCEETFIEASEALGCTRLHTALNNILPNTLSPLVVQISVVLGAAVTAEASLSFLGLGVQAPEASWGSMLATGYTNLRVAPFLVWAPGLMIVLTVLAFSLVGDGLRDAIGAQRNSVEGGSL